MQSKHNYHNKYHYKFLYRFVCNSPYNLQHISPCMFLYILPYNSENMILYIHLRILQYNFHYNHLVDLL